MGSYTDLTVASYPIITSKSVVVPEAMTIFRETDRHVFTRRVAERNPLVWGEPECMDDEETETAIEYACETGKAIDRLNIMGFTMRRVREEFEIGRQKEFELYMSYRNWDSILGKLGRDNSELLENLTFDTYAEAFAKIIADGRKPISGHVKDEEGCNPLIEYILRGNDTSSFGFFEDDKDIRLVIRLACEVAPENAYVVQDITEIIHAGYYSEDEAVCEKETRALIAGYPENAPIIILTEGSTDAEFLREALALLYPHLSAYYSFLDSHSPRPDGGAGPLVSLVKAFSAAGITNRVIALLDNDTAAQDAKRGLKVTDLPSNIAVMHYPDLDLLRTYPTLGPGGLEPLDVNGLAASIELYLGEDVLCTEQNTLIPVQWKGYNSTLGQYQGEVVQKRKLHDAFRKKLKRCKANPQVSQDTDWSGLSAILQEIFRAFESSDE